MRITLNSLPPHDAQRRVIDELLSHVGTKGIRRIHAKAGRGGGKTALGVLAIFESMATYNRGLPHLWTEQDYDDCETVFLPVWQDLIPSVLYTLVRRPMTIRLSQLVGGARLDVRSRYARSPKERRGGTYAGAVTDEAAQDPGGKPTLLIEKMLRHPRARSLWHLITTTPRAGWYNEMVKRSTDPVFTWSSWENKYVDKETFDDFCKDMTEEEIQQEMHAALVSLSGLVWSEFADAAHPQGNRHPHRFDPRQPWTLSCDIGNRSAWLVLQTVSSADGPVDVIVAEYQPDHGDTTVMIDRISRDYGYPSTVVAGSDASDSHRSIQTGLPHAVLFRQAWPGARILWPTGSNVSKERQVWHAKSRVCHPRSKARLVCVSSGLVSHDKGKRRGVLEMFASDSWPEAGEVGGAALVRKDKARNPQSYEDTRDALLYAMVCLHPPRASDPGWRR